MTPKMYQKTTQNGSKMAPGTPRGLLGTHMESRQILGPLKMPLFRPLGPPGGTQEGHFENSFGPRAPLRPPLGTLGGPKKEKVTPQGRPKPQKVCSRLSGASISQNRLFRSKIIKNDKSQPPGGPLGPLGCPFCKRLRPWGDPWDPLKDVRAILVVFFWGRRHGGEILVTW